MATAQSLITRSLRLLQVVGAGETPNATDLADCLVAMNAMLDGWRNQPQAAYVVDEISGSLVAGQQTYTLGTGGSFNATRPVRIENARCLIGGTFYPIVPITQQQWNNLDTAQSGTPEVLYASAGYPLMTINLSPIPSASGTLTLGVLHPFTAFAAVGDTAAFPPGYEECIVYQLAMRLAPEYGVAASSEVARTAVESLAAIKRMNFRPITADLGLTGVIGNVQYDINAGV